MPCPPFEIRLPPQFEVTEEPSLIGTGRGGLYVVQIEDDRGRRGVIVTRETRLGVVRSMVVYDSEIRALADWLWARQDPG